MSEFSVGVPPRSFRFTAGLLASVAAGLVLPVAVQAQTTNNCPQGDRSTSCAITNQNAGDTSNPSEATGTTSTSSQSGTSAASNASDLTISPNIEGTVMQNSTNTTTGTISGGNVTGGNVTGGNTSGTVTGGDTSSAATGNTTTSDNQSNAVTGASSSTSGGNTLGGASAAVGNTSASGGSLTGGANTASGGSGGGGGLGGTSSATTGSLTGGTNSTSNVNTVGASGASNSSTNLDLSDRSVSHNNQRWIFIPPVVPPTPPSSLAVGNIVNETGACGMLQRVIREPVDGRFYGLFVTTKVPQGFTERLVPVLDDRGIQQDYRRVPLEDGSGYRLFGHQVTQHTTVLGVSGARNFAIGGGGGGGGWGQAGGGGSSAMQQMVTTIQLRECEVGSIVNPAPPRVVYVEPARIRQ